MRKLFGFFILGMLVVHPVKADDTKLLEDFDHLFSVTWDLVETLDDREAVEIEFKDILTDPENVSSYNFDFQSQFTAIEERELSTVAESHGTIIETDNQLEIIEFDSNEDIFRYGSSDEPIAYEYVPDSGQYLNLYDYGHTLDELILHRYFPVHDFLLNHESLFNTYQNDTHYILEVVTEDKDFGNGLDYLRTITTSDFIAESFKYGMLITIDKESGTIEDSLILTSVELPEQNTSLVSELYANYSAFNTINDLEDYSAEISRLMQETEGLSNFFKNNKGHSRYLQGVLSDIEGLKDSDETAQALIEDIPFLENYLFTLVTDLTFRALSSNQIDSESEQVLGGYISETDDFLSVQAYLITLDGEYLVRYGNTEQDVAWLNDTQTGGVYQDTNLFPVEEVVYFRYKSVLEQLKLLRDFTVHESDDYYYLSSEGDANLKESFDKIQYTYNDDFIEGSDRYGLLITLSKPALTIQDMVFYRTMDTKDGDYVAYLEVIGRFLETTDFEPNLNLDELD